MNRDEAEHIELRGWFDVQTGKPVRDMGVWRADGKPHTMQQLFDQSDWWRNGQRDWVSIDSIDDRYAINLCAFLEQRAEIYKMRYELAMCRQSGFPMGDMAQDAFDAEFDLLLDEPTLDWLHRTKLYRAIKARITTPEDT